MHKNSTQKYRFQHTAARRRLPLMGGFYFSTTKVSTHSRPKAAAIFGCNRREIRYGFNTQPPEGGCRFLFFLISLFWRFQHTAARRRLRPINPTKVGRIKFQHTAARRRLPFYGRFFIGENMVSTHSRPKAAAPKIHHYPPHR